MKYYYDTEPRAFRKLRQVPTSILDAAHLMMELNLSRAELKKVHEYCERGNGAVRVRRRYPDAKRVKRNIRKACLRSKEEGKKIETFRVDKDYPGCPAQTVTFEVRMLAFQLFSNVHSIFGFGVEVDRCSSPLC